MADKIRVHNKGKRTIDYYPDPIPKTKKKNHRPERRKVKFILPGRAVEMDEKIAKKYLAAYPNDLVEFDSLVSGDKKDLSKENKRLESENASYLEKIGKLEEEVQILVDNIPKTDKALSEENRELRSEIKELKKDLGEETKPEEEEE